MAIKKVTEYTGDVADPYGSQSQADFTQNAFDQFGYLKNFSPDLNSTIDEMNAAITDVETSEANAAGSAAAAEAAAQSGNYQGLWPDVGGSAVKGDIWQTQVGGTPTGEYFIALQNTTVDPVADDVNWRVSGTIGKDNLPKYTDLVFDTVADMTSSESLKIGYRVRTYEFNQPAVSDWVIVSSGNGDMTDGTLPVSGGLYAMLIPSECHTVAHYGAFNDGSNNDFDSMSSMHSNTGRIKLIYRGNHKLQGTLVFPEGTQRKDIDLNNSKITIGSIIGEYLFIINGNFTVQSFLNIIRNAEVDLNGAKGLVDWNSGSFDSGLKNILIYDTSLRSDVIAVRSFNSFNMTFEKLRTGPTMKGTHLLLSENNFSGFFNLTNVKIKDSILQTSQNDTKLIDIDLPDTAADTITIENTALKANGTGSVSVNIDGYINSLSLKSLHMESSDTVIKTAAGKTIKASMQDCTISDCKYTFDWAASGWISARNNDWVNGAGSYSGKEVFKLLNAEFSQNGVFIVDFSNYDTEIKSGTGTFRRDKKEVTRKTSNFAPLRTDDKRDYFNPSGPLTVTLPESSLVKSGYIQGLQVRTGVNRFQCQGGDRILGISGTTTDGGIQSSNTGDYVEVTCQNDDGGNKFWQVTSAVGGWVGD